MDSHMNEDNDTKDPNREIRRLARSLAIGALIWSGLEAGILECLDIASEDCSEEFLKKAKQILWESEGRFLDELE